MKIKGIVTILVAFVFLFVTATADLSAAKTIENTEKEVKKAAAAFSMSINEADMELMQNDFILSSIDGGGQYYSRSMAWLWISLAVLLVVLVLLLVLIEDNYTYWWY